MSPVDPRDAFLDGAQRPLAAPAPLEVRDVLAPTLPGPAPDPTAAPGRAAAAVTGRAWAPAWRAPLPAGVAPRRVLATGERALVVGAAAWALFAQADGAAVAALALPPDDEVLLDRGRDQLVCLDALGFLVGRRLVDGRSAWRLQARGGPGFEKRLVARRGERVVVCGVERPGGDVHGPPTASALARVELHAVGDAPPLDEDGAVEGDTCLADVLRPAPGTRFARHGDALALASRDRVHLLDLAHGLAVRRALAPFEPFEPRALAFDEAGRLLLVAAVAGGAPLLWGLTQGGERSLQAALPAGLGPAIAPPVCGPEGRVYVEDARHLLAFEADGRLAWGRLARGVAGAVVAACGAVVATLDGVVVALDGRGNLRELARADEPFVTGPALLDDGRLLVAGARALHAFAPA